MVRHSKELEEYQRVAETVGFLPSVRWKDNLFQGICIAACTVVAAFVGWMLWDLPGLIGLAIGGLIGGTIISGIVLMILGVVRAARKSN